MGKCTVKEEWFKKKDCNNNVVSDWATKNNDREIFCKVCPCSINIEKGFQAIEQHALTAKHKKNVSILHDFKQLYMIPSTLSEIDQPSSSVELYNVKDPATISELIWVLKCVANNFPAASCTGISEVFKAMFLNSNLEALKQFSLSRTKMSYYLTEALEPYFKEHLLKDMKGVFYTLCFDETTNASGKKELQVIARYWSDICNRVVNRHLELFFIGKATAEVLADKLMKALDNAHLPLRNMLLLGCDGPNVNKAVIQIINEKVTCIRGKKLIDIGTCNIHILHNAFLKGLSELGQDVSDLIVLVYTHFDDRPSRWENFETLQNKLNLPNHRFIKHSTTRWLTLEPAARRLLEQWEALLKYFLNFLPKNNTKFTSTAKYQNIVTHLKTSTMKAEILFVCGSAEIFTRFTKRFQKDEPLIHLLYTEIETVAQTLLGRICKSPVTSLSDLTCDDLFSDKNLIPSKEIICNDAILNALKNVSEKDKLLFLRDIRKHYIASSKYVIKNCLKHCLLKNLKCLQPKLRLSEQSIADIRNIGKALPFDVNIDRLSDEWRLLQIEKDINTNEKARIDDYWYKIFSICDASGQSKYPIVTAVVKACLSFTHGNADIERRFSCSSYALTDIRSSMNERTLNAIMTTKDHLELYNNKPELVPISKDLLVLARGAHKSYQQYKEEKIKKKEMTERERKEEEEKKKKKEERLRKGETEKQKITEEEELLKQIRCEEDQAHKVANELIIEASNRLEDAIKKKDFTGAKLAHTMLQSVREVQKEENCKRNETLLIQKSIDKRKSTFITNFFSKKPKM